ncbi:hypothetical protein RJ640_029451 [Escallonia rubra]|uniref:Uncharacterized protein n=1 Tax=Escallonia rubra TaxID=112253 RepID=A0AA88RV79_9ASTE|nr:hypothetical protein RJ640_029451 [Escallonia rubra]
MTSPDNERFEDTDESIDDRGTNESSSSREISENSGDSRQGGEAGLTERLTDILVDDGDGDLLFEREDGVLQWLQALDMQVMGACRTAERLKPLLKLNQTSGAAEDRFLAHLTQVRFLEILWNVTQLTESLHTSPELIISSTNSTESTP